MVYQLNQRLSVLYETMVSQNRRVLRIFDFENLTSVQLFKRQNGKYVGKHSLKMVLYVLRGRCSFLRNCGTRLFADKAKPNAYGLTEKPEPHEITTDYIGPPDQQSNLRPYVRCVPKDETPLARSLREKQIEVEEWNQDFWSRHNKRFYDEKEDFIRLHKIAGIDEISADKMSVFYKSFLDKNRKMHLLYNISWYLKNLDLLMLAGQVNIQKLWKSIRQ